MTSLSSATHYEETQITTEVLVGDHPQRRLDGTSTVPPWRLRGSHGSSERRLPVLHGRDLIAPRRSAPRSRRTSGRPGRSGGESRPSSIRSRLNCERRTAFAMRASRALTVVSVSVMAVLCARPCDGRGTCCGSLGRAHCGRGEAVSSCPRAGPTTALPLFWGGRGFGTDAVAL